MIICADETGPADRDAGGKKGDSEIDDEHINPQICLNPRCVTFDKYICKLIDQLMRRDRGIFWKLCS